jgi:HlyD family secretion protein
MNDVQPDDRKRPIELGIQRYLIAGLSASLLFLGGAGSLAAVSKIAGEVIGTGKLVVDSNVKAVQHLKGGIVSEILVKEGDTVKAGDVVVRLDDTVHPGRPCYSRRTAL